MRQMKGHKIFNRRFINQISPRPPKEEAPDLALILLYQEYKETYNNISFHLRNASGKTKVAHIYFYCVNFAGYRRSSSLTPGFSPVSRMRHSIKSHSYSNASLGLIVK